MVVKDVEVPSIKADELLVRLAGASLCASDLVAYKGFHGNVEGRVGGHEGVGYVAQGKLCFCLMGFYRACINVPVCSWSVCERVQAR